MMNDVDKLLKDLSRSARSEPVPKIDIRARVIDTLSDCPRKAPLDLLPLTFAGFALATAAGMLITFWPTWQTLSEPWVAYFP